MTPSTRLYALMTYLNLKGKLRPYIFKYFKVSQRPLSWKVIPFEKPLQAVYHQSHLKIHF